MEMLLKKLGIEKSKLVNKDFDLICDKYTEKQRKLVSMVN
jgi:hypothetical protein